MKKISAILLFAMFAIACNNNKEKSRAELESFTLNKGINISHWLSQVYGFSPRATYIKESDIAFIAKSGFDHIRLPFDEKEFWDEKGLRNETAFLYLDSCITWAIKHRLRVVADFHILRSHYFNAENEKDAKPNTLWSDTSAQNHFVNLWLDMQKSLEKYPNAWLAYELLNEPVAPDPEMWNVLIHSLIKAIRVKEPQRTILVGGNMWQMPEMVPYIKLPKGDTNIIIAMHVYHPLLVTHYTASWTLFKAYKGPIHYPGISVTEDDINKYVDKKDTVTLKEIRKFNGEFNREVLIQTMMPAIKKAKESNVKLYCGEWGCFKEIPRDIRIKVYKDMISIFNEYNIAYAAWDYKGSFGIVNYDFNKFETLEPDTQIINILVKR